MKLSLSTGGLGVLSGPPEICGFWVGLQMVHSSDILGHYTLIPIRFTLISKKSEIRLDKSRAVDFFEHCKGWTVVIKLSVLSDLSDICTFGPILKALLQDQMPDRSLKSLPYTIDHKILI